MIRLLAALALASVAVPGTAAAQVDASVPRPSTPASPLLPDTVLLPPGGPRVVVLAAPGEGVAALRLAVPLREGPTEAGVGTLLRDLARDRMEALARPVGARVSVSRTPWGIAYAVEGAAADFEYLAYLLRQGVSAPAVDVPAFQRARQRLRELAARTTETPGGRMVAELRARAAPEATPPWGGGAGLEPPDAARVREAWLRSHQSSGMTLVVSAPVVPEVVLAATRGMGAPESAAAEPLDSPAPQSGTRPRVETIRRWYGEAWTWGAETDEPHAPVVALLLADHLRRTAPAGDYEVGVELWELPDRWVLALVGSAYERRAAAMRGAVGGALASVRDALDPAAVANAVARARGDLLFQSRTPAGLVSLVGRAMEASGDPGAAARQLAALDRVDAASMAAFLTTLIGRGPVRAEVRP